MTTLNATLPLKSIPRPPGPKGLPFLGNLLDFQRDMLGFIVRLARYGDIAYFRFLNYHAYFVAQPDAIERVLVGTNDRDFSKTPGDQMNALIFGNGLLTSMGDEWKRQHKLVQPAFHRQRINAYAETMTAHAERLLATWQPGATRDVHADMMRVTLEIAVKTLFDVDITEQANEAGAALEVVMRELAQRLGDPTPLFLPTPSNLRLRRAVKRLDDIIYAIIRQRRASDHDTGDLLSMLLQARDEDGSGMDDRLLRDEVMTLFIAGHETTALALSWAWYLLAQNPEVEAKLAAELQAVLGGRLPTLADLPHLPYTEKVVKEAMRLYPPAYMVDARLALRDCDIEGWPVPKGSVVMVSQWAAHRDPRWYPDPQRFYPDRWTEAFTQQLPKYAYFPFGGGQRICIGNSFAMMEAILLLATLAQRYRLELAPGQTVTPQPSITLRPKHGIQVTLHSR